MAGIFTHLDRSGKDDHTPNDLALVAQVRGGAVEQFEVLVHRHERRLARIGHACLHRPELVDDAMQNAYLQAFVHLDQFRRTASFATWLTRIMVNECRRILRDRRAGREDRWLQERDECLADRSVVPPECELQRGELRELLERAILELPQRARRVYTLREIEHLSTAETGECLGLSEANVKVILHRAREQLRTLLLRSAAAAELLDLGRSGRLLAVDHA